MHLEFIFDEPGEIDFKNIVHTKENNSHSEQILFDQYERLNRNCKTLYDAMSRGAKLTGYDVVRNFRMIEYRKRFQEINIALKKAGRPPLKEVVLENGCKQWSIENK